MDKEELLMDIIHRLESKIDKIEEQVSGLTAFKDKVLGIITVATLVCTVCLEFLKNIFSIR